MSAAGLCGRLPRAVILAVVPAWLAGCAVVEVTAPAGDVVATEWHPGVLVVRLEPGDGADAVVAEAIGAGVLARPGALSVGAWRETVAAVAPGCRLVVWPRSGAELETVLARLKDVPGHCVIGTPPGGGKTKGEDQP
ncbi:hypothetical protein C882_2707 [Caenispirillum salinarum AK4]|uniref:Uncharacterized protein n=1 Tax=Caenispirillum salinarum AK4 TaxID=1238182 RepID=K9HQU0_9PROT|nr:hypothetical protein [Caenispirillum salinarum]EKV32628.1 hypothetical protein C882_2707 [Caenispirillum salinarum AK4]